MTKREVSDLVTVVITNCDWPEWKRELRRKFASLERQSVSDRVGLDRVRVASG